MSDPLASLRSKLANGPHVVTSVATPGKTNPPSASGGISGAPLRAPVQGSKGATSQPVTVSTDRLTRVEQAVKLLLTPSQNVAANDQLRAQLVKAFNAA
jgi:hypothetical protein